MSAKLCERKDHEFVASIVDAAIKFKYECNAEDKNFPTKDESLKLRKSKVVDMDKNANVMGIKIKVILEYVTPDPYEGPIYGTIRMTTKGNE